MQFKSFKVSRARRACVLGGLAALAMGHAAANDVYPSRAIKLICMIPPGSTTDSMLRYLAERMGTVLGQPIIVENKIGANGVIGTRAIASATPDGYTIGMTSNGTLSAAPALFKNPGYDIYKDFTHIGMFSYLPYTLVVQKDLPPADLKAFIAYARANPGKLSAGHYANSLRMATMDLKRAAKLDFAEISYKAPPQLLTDLKLGLVQFSFVPLNVATVGQQAGFLKIIGVTSEKRWSLLKDVPALSEELPGFSNVAWTALSAPAGTPPAIVAKLQSALKQVLQSPDTREKWAALGADVAVGDAQDVRRLIDRDVPLWGQFAKEANIAPE